MDDTEKNFAGEEYEPQNIEDITPDENLVTGNGAEQQDAGVNDHQLHLNGNDSEPLNATEVEKDGNDAVPVQNHAENESEQNLPEMEVKPESPENDSKEEFNENDQSETKEPDEEMHREEGVEHGNDLPAGTEDKKWPGWPGESVFRMLVPAQKVGNIIGRKGEYIKKIVEETRARIKILDGPPGTAERAVMVSAREEPDSSFPPAMDGLLRVHQRIVDGLEGDPAQVVAAAAAKVSTKLLVPASQAGSLIGKQGATVKSIQETSNCIVRVLGSEDLPVFALQDDRVVEVVGEPAAVHKAMELIAAQLRKFLVDRSIIPLFEMQMQNPTKHNHMDHHMPPHQPSWGPPPHHGHGLPPSAGGYGSGSQYMPPPPRQMDSYYPPPDMAPPPAERQPHHGISAYGRDTPMGGPPSSNSQSAPSMITQITQHMQVPLSYADAVIGASGSNISYIRRASGATVTIQETRGVPGEMTVEISGSASQVQAAQQLIQNFMAGAGGPAPTQSGAPTDQGSYNQGYSSYGGGAPGSTYGSPPSSAGYASQGGGYGSVYGSNYGY